eukprot:jgi/Ulvmu1/9708/UM055_0046.1
MDHNTHLTLLFHSMRSVPAADGPLAGPNLQAAAAEHRFMQLLCDITSPSTCCKQQPERDTGAQRDLPRSCASTSGSTNIFHTSPTQSDTIIHQRQHSIPQTDFKPKPTASSHAHLKGGIPAVPHARVGCVLPALASLRNLQGEQQTAMD